SVKSGIADVGWCFHGYWPNMTPLADVVSLPAMPFRSAEEGSATLWKLYKKFPQIQKEFADNKVLTLFTSDPYLLITTKKQVKSLQDIKGLKIRMTGGPPTDMMRALGGIPTLIPMPDNYISLQKGVVDGMGTPWEAFNSFRFYEVIKYVTTNTPFPSVYFSLSMNKNKWNSLPKDIQDAIMSVGGEKGARFNGANYFDSAKGEVINKAKAAGYKLVYYNLPESEREKWLEIGGKPIWEAWVKKMEKKGKKGARDILNAALKLAKE
ncbi:MAG: TRAP transporter substrate-binding protein, partial [Deltaproteobacteria bacterium]|nr:TRAP transporter substrate-binding protein [Deltaproteobacteria bacterium]